MRTITLPAGFYARRLSRNGDHYTSLEAAQKASKASCLAIEAVAKVVADGKPRIDEEIWQECRANGFLSTFATVRHARLSLSEAGYLVETGVARKTTNSARSREWVWCGAANNAAIDLE